MLKALARYVLRDELNILNNRVFQAECCESMALDLSEERALMCNELRKQLHAADHDNAFLYEQLRELHLDKEILAEELEEQRRERAKLALWVNTSEFDEF